MNSIVKTEKQETGFELTISYDRNQVSEAVAKKAHDATMWVLTGIEAMIVWTFGQISETHDKKLVQPTRKIASFIRSSQVKVVATAIAAKAAADARDELACTVVSAKAKAFIESGVVKPVTDAWSATAEFATTNKVAMASKAFLFEFKADESVIDIEGQQVIEDNQEVSEEEIAEIRSLKVTIPGGKGFSQKNAVNAQYVMEVADIAPVTKDKMFV